ncbi:MAG: transposase, partial [Planctomycetaceae bacterium]|nr:transposase [Planctomycetaceae bacterium]
MVVKHARRGRPLFAGDPKLPLPFSTAASHSQVKDSSNPASQSRKTPPYNTNRIKPLFQRAAKHELRGAIESLTNREERCMRFLESGAIRLDNNASEQAVKLPVIGKKAWLFFG